ncbi:DUF3558 domain-containing protein [Mycolicibacterium grossiae]|uniref:LprB protein n=1 Tax=Mycolicibacterium grossiae TaxID=1552759 RepID=A0A1E8Q7E4_9MYCO|nr:DUF3558 domain-containing protein [Mycolicibacterium grossiae]OFJ54365.1 lprB protein [Mycolicibacterium grossiae]QEM45271.1 DUF3558 domain-containing protein [Mycolicibacterium grossiae]
MPPRTVVGVLAAAALLAGCGPHADDEAASASGPGYRAAECNGVTDADVTRVVGTTLFTRVVDGEAGCFWQENTAIGSFGVGMGISTWWYRGSDLDTERRLERDVGRQLTELTMAGNAGFSAADDNACSVYVAKGADVVTWSIQTMNPAMLPDLCTVATQLAQLSQDRMN